MVNLAATRSTSGAFKRSPSGARTRLQGDKYYYFSDPQYVEVNMSDFSGWTSAAFSTGMFADLDEVSIDLYDGTTKDYIGEIIQPLSCTPKTNIYHLGSVTDSPIGSDIPPTACPDLEDPPIGKINYEKEVNTPNSTYLAAWQGISTIMPIDLQPATWYHYKYLTKFWLSTSFSVTTDGPPDSTHASRSILTGYNFYRHPISNDVLIRLNNKFYPFRLSMIIDVDIDTWAYGKFSNYEGVDGRTVYRETLDFTDWYMLRNEPPPFDSNNFNIIYDGCFKTNSKVRIW
jgi:hypothetical protein